MVNISFDEIIKLAEQLPENQQNELIYHLRIKQIESKMPQLKSDELHFDDAEVDDAYHSLSREELLDELHNLRSSGAFTNVESLYGKYVNPNVPDMSAETLHAELHHIATEWEQELDDFDTDDN
jgi:hypothetical protein